MCLSALIIIVIFSRGGDCGHDPMSGLQELIEKLLKSSFFSRLKFRGY